MSNQRVVVLTDEESTGLYTAIGYYPTSGGVHAHDFGLHIWLAARDYYREHPEGITDDMIVRAKYAYNHTLVSANPWRAALEAALYLGDKQ